MSIKVALIVRAPIELTLNAGREEINPPPVVEEPAEDIEDTPFFKVGIAETDELHISGPLIGDPDNLSDSLSISYYFPDEESEENARPVDADTIKVITQITPRQKADPGWRWRYRLESRRPHIEVKIFEGGFQPPFRPSDISVVLDHLINYGYDGYILSSMRYGYRIPSITEADWRFPKLESAGYLPD